MSTTGAAPSLTPGRERIGAIEGVAALTHKSPREEKTEGVFLLGSDYAEMSGQ